MLNNILDISSSVAEWLSVFIFTRGAHNIFVFTLRAEHNLTYIITNELLNGKKKKKDNILY